MQVRKSIGPFAAPKAIHVVPDLPKTRSGKIMRRILRKILAGEEDQLGDITTVSTQNTRQTMRTNTDLSHSSQTLQSSKRSSRLCMPARSKCIATIFEHTALRPFSFGYHFFFFSLSSKLMSTDLVRAVNRRCRTTIYYLLTIPNIRNLLQPSSSLCRLQSCIERISISPRAMPKTQTYSGLWTRGTSQDRLQLPSAMGYKHLSIYPRH
jgi:hypothetical protein